jgi:hypothetical protein
MGFPQEVNANRIWPKYGKFNRARLFVKSAAKDGRFLIL